MIEHVGGQFSFWNRRGIRLTQTGVGLVRNSILPVCAAAESQGQANFVVRIFIYNAGVDADTAIKAIFSELPALP
jgi:hypothetical protein